MQVNLMKCNGGLWDIFCYVRNGAGMFKYHIAPVSGAALDTS